MAKKQIMMREAIIDGNALTGDNGSPMLNPRFGNQNGRGPVIGGIDVDGIRRAEFMSSQGWAPRNLRAIVMQYPGFMDLVPNGEILKDAFQEFIEKAPETITGIDASQTIETEENFLGGSGAEVLDEPIDAKMNRSNISYGLNEKNGRVWQRLITFYQDYGIIDKHTKTNRLVEVSDVARELFERSLYSMDMFSFSVMYYIPDMTGSHPVDAFLHLGGFPKTAGERTAELNTQSAQGLKKLTIDMAGFTLVDNGVMELARDVMKGLPIRYERNLVVTPFEERDADMADNNYGFNAGSDHR